MNIHTLPETHLFLFKIQKHFNLKTLPFSDRQKKKKKKTLKNKPQANSATTTPACVHLGRAWPTRLSEPGSRSFGLRNGPDRSWCHIGILDCPRISWTSFRVGAMRPVSEACRVSWVSVAIHWWFRRRGSDERRQWRRRLNRRWTCRCLWHRIRLRRPGVQGGSWSTHSTQGFGSWRLQVCRPRWCRQDRKRV